MRQLYGWYSLSYKHNRNYLSRFDSGLAKLLIDYNYYYYSGEYYQGTTLVTLYTINVKESNDLPKHLALYTPKGYGNNAS